MRHLFLHFHSEIPTVSVNMWQYTWSINLSVLHVFMRDLPPDSRLAGLSLGPICVTIVIEQSPSLCVDVVFPVGCVCLCVCVCVCQSFCNIPTGNSTQVSWCVHYKSSLISLKLPPATTHPLEDICIGLYLCCCSVVVGSSVPFVRVVCKDA